MYKVLPDGNILGQRGQALKAYSNSAGYLRVALYLEGKRQQYFVHRLVALEFVPNPDNLPEIDHIDGDKTNNHFSNLEWVTSSTNKSRALKAGLNLGRRGTGKYPLGVRPSKSGKRWHVIIQSQGKKHFSAHDTIEQAVAQRKAIYRKWDVTEPNMEIGHDD